MTYNLSLFEMLVKSHTQAFAASIETQEDRFIVGEYGTECGNRRRGTTKVLKNLKSALFLMNADSQAREFRSCIF